MHNRPGETKICIHRDHSRPRIRDIIAFFSQESRLFSPNGTFYRKINYRFFTGWTSYFHFWQVCWTRTFFSPAKHLFYSENTGLRNVKWSKEFSWNLPCIGAAMFLMTAHRLCAGRRKCFDRNPDIFYTCAVGIMYYLHRPVKMTGIHSILLVSNKDAVSDVFFLDPSNNHAYYRSLSVSNIHKSPIDRYG